MPASRRGDGIAERAIAWYALAARDLPWRTPDTSAWGVLVSELMLHQTPVARVVPRYQEWLRRWPTPAALAIEPAGAAIQAWGRLGYPRRALRLHDCATVITARHGGVVPGSVEELLALPGVGSYTARAVAAFAYRQRAPVVDTNVRRLVARAVLGRAQGGAVTTEADLTVVEALLPREPSRAALASAALMELGALICTARAPACDVCPLLPATADEPIGPAPIAPDNVEPGAAAEPKTGPAGASGRRGCAWHRLGRPAAPAAPRRPGPGYRGTDRQARGVLLGLCRAATGPVDLATLTGAWPDAVQGQRALAGLLHDGLIVKIDETTYGLPGLS